MNKYFWILGILSAIYLGALAFGVKFRIKYRNKMLEKAFGSTREWLGGKKEDEK